VLDSDATTGRLAWQLEVSRAVGGEGEFRPTRLMEKVSEYLERWGEPASRGQIEQDVKGKAEYLRRAIDVLVAEEFAVEFRGDHRAKMVKLDRPFREADEWAES
jgi:hypothetical protein